MKKIKNAWKSLTIWFNSIVATVVVALPELASYFPVLKEYLPDNIYKQAMTLLLIGNLLLRFRTKEDLADK